MIIKARSITKEHAINSLGYIVQEKKNHIVLGSDGADISSARSFIADCSYYSKDVVKKEFISTVISPFAGDNLQLEDMKNLLLEVQLQLGLNNRQFFAVIHQDTATPHIHLISNRIDYNHMTWNDHHVSAQCQAACAKISKKLNLTSAHHKDGTYKESLEKMSEFEQRRMLNIRFIQNQFKDVKFIAKDVNEVFDHLRSKGVEVNISKHKTGRYGVSMKYNDTVVKGSKVDRLLTLVPDGDTYKPNPRMEKILMNNKARVERTRTQNEIAQDLIKVEPNSVEWNDLVQESTVWRDFELARYGNFRSENDNDDYEDFLKRKRRNRSLSK